MIAFVADGEHDLFNVLCLLISFAGLLVQLLDLKKLWADLKWVYNKSCRACSRGEEYDVSSEEKTGPCGSIFGGLKYKYNSMENSEISAPATIMYQVKPDR